MKLLKTLSMAFCFCWPTLSPAGTMGVARPTFDGLFLGGNLGGALTTAKASEISAALNINVVSTLFSQEQYQQYSMYKNSLAGTLFAGYARTYRDSLYGSLELFLNLANRNMNQTLTSKGRIADNFSAPLLFLDTSKQLTSSTSLSLRNPEYGVDLRLGKIFMMDTLFYGRVGVSFNKLQWNSQLSSAYIGNFFNGFIPVPSATAQTTAVGFTSSKNVAALRLGFGVERKLSLNTSFTFDYIFSNYSGSISDLAFRKEPNDPIGVAPISTADGMRTTSSATVQNHAVLLGLIYRFV